MTYEAYEESTYAGSPIELYRFDRAGATEWTYTSADIDQDYGGETYTAIPMSRSSIEQSQDLEKASLTINMPSDTPMLAQYISASPTDVVTLTLHRFHNGDNNTVSTWVGRISNIGFNGYEAEVYCESTLTSLRRPTGRMLYQIDCPHVLYGTRCGAVQSTFAIEATLISVSGLDIQAGAFAGGFGEGYFSGGLVTLVSAGLTTRRFVTDHSGNTITLNLPLTGAVVGSAVTAYPGCNHSTDHCNTKFSNLPNYGGQPFYPEKNPFESMVF